MDNAKQGKKSYEAPAFRVVRLEVKTSVLNVCRTSTSQISSQAHPTNCKTGPLNPCSV
jgi:hypothetical protein